MSSGSLIENSTNLISKRTGKWSGNELENDFLIASIVGTEVTMNLTVGMSFEMEMNVDMLDQLILLVQLSDVSVTSTNDYST